MELCRSCNAKINATHKFCHECGASQTGAPPPAAAAAPPPRGGAG
eukprot:CAMPEP_0173431922 /NCGR_PEP_ID=MMETSP1357-20121228/9903_1 /TAXON_ID=77926 /ORGANISM="Hemiselmis rufescens, Strain PCC563" /LENGTH=44 /DNA_ID= /DNA_START= /DNA_END= /DNA_ORIENTATION=